VKPRRTSIPSCFNVLNPGSSKVTPYVPGGTAGKRYSPSGFVTAVCTPIIAGLLTVTVTPGSTAPLESATLPLIVPVELAPPPCANACADANRHAASTATKMESPRRLMNVLLLLEKQQSRTAKGSRD